MAPIEDDILTPSQLNSLARNALEDMFGGIKVEGEIGNLARPASGHLYFTLKDERAQVRCALFKPKSQRLDFVPADGTRVVVHGKISLYEPRGDYQLIADGMTLAGEGELRRQLERLRRQLQAEGLFDPVRKRALPRFVRRLAVITSPSGAAIRDVISVIARRFPMIEVDVVPVLVQGTTAPAQILAALQWADQSERYDAILLTRGGGSLEDLWAFNDEALVRAIAAAKTPTVSAVGHESDTTLSDFAADIRAATPSAASELLTPASADLHARLSGDMRQLSQRNRHALDLARRHLDQTAKRLTATSPLARMQTMHERAKAVWSRLQSIRTREHAMRAQRLLHARARLLAKHPAALPELLAIRSTTAMRRLADASNSAVRMRVQKLQGLGRTLHAISPLATVDRGYALVQDTRGALIQSVDQVSIGDELVARVRDGRLSVKVTAKEKDA